MSATKKMWQRRFSLLNPITWITSLLNLIGTLIGKFFCLFFDFLPLWFALGVVTVLVVSCMSENTDERNKTTVATMAQIEDVRKNPALTACVDMSIESAMKAKDFQFLSVYALGKITEVCTDQAELNIVGDIDTTSKAQAEALKKMIGTPSK